MRAPYLGDETGEGGAPSRGAIEWVLLISKWEGLQVMFLADFM